MRKLKCATYRRRPMERNGNECKNIPQGMGPKPQCQFSTHQWRFQQLRNRIDPPPPLFLASTHCQCHWNSGGFQITRHGNFIIRIVRHMHRHGNTIMILRSQTTRGQTSEAVWRGCLKGIRTCDAPLHFVLLALPFPFFLLSFEGLNS